MSLWRWIKSWFGAAPTRDISRLDTSRSASDANEDVEERIDVSGGPLKEHHRRRALRDPRLLPKLKSPARQLGLTKKKAVMSRTEAQRLFGGTLRTRNRQLRDLLPDEEQLKRLNLPVWRTEEDLASALGVSRRELWFFSIHRERERRPHYVTFSLPKRTGGQRMIQAPKRRLKAIQRRLVSLLVSHLPVSDHAHAFRTGRSIRTGAEPHVGQRLLLKLDLKDFFPSVTFARVRGLLVSYGYSYPVATTLAVLMTEAERQPVEVDGEIFFVPVGPRHCVQGAPTSPGLCNALLLRLDRRLAGLARKRQLIYTRYADDLSFSGDLDRSQAESLRALATHLIASEGFTVNAKKTRVMTRGSRQSVTHVVVNQTLGISRQERRRWRASAHQLSRRPESERAGIRARLEGRIAFLHMLNPQQAEALARRMPRSA